MVRFSPDGQQQEVFADGFRNPYDLDFNPAGQLFTVDSDNERDHHLPWYAPTRLFDIAQGMQHGWLRAGWQQSWNRPQSFFDNVERLVEIGRGSPTGVVCYRHRQFPPHYRGGIFSACWTLGRVYYFPLEEQGSTYASHCETFLETTGEIGFAPCDLAVGPDGDLFIAVGGRRTQGSVFRVHYAGPDAGQPAEPSNELAQVLAADQPLSSWSRAKWEPLAEKLGREAFERAVLDEKLPLPQRVRAVEVLVDRFGGVSLVLAEQAAAAKIGLLSARIAWAVGRSQRDAAAFELESALTADDDPRVQRAAWEALAVMPAKIAAAVETMPNWPRGFKSTDRRVRSAAIGAASRGGKPLYLMHAGKMSASIAESLAQLRVGVRPTEDVFFATCVESFEANKSPVLRMEVIRMIQIGLGDLQIQPGQAEVFSGYRSARSNRIDPRTTPQSSSIWHPPFRPPTSN